MKKLIFLLPVILISILALVLIFTNQKTQISNNKVKIVAAENFYGDIASQIGGSNVTVLSVLTNPSQDPHEYEATSNDARNISDADIIVENGLGYDSFMDSILSTVSSKKVINVGSIVGLTESDNPHLWYNIDYIKTFASNLKNTLNQVDPNNQTAYSNNYTTFISSLFQIQTLCQTIKSTYTGTQVIATERVADYMLNNCGLAPIANTFQKAIEEGNDPSIDSINLFENALKNHQAKMLIYNDQTVSAVTEKEKSLAQDNNVPIVGVTETMPLNTTYQNWMLSELQEINNNLK